MDGLQYARISYITAFPQKTDKRMSCYDRYSSRIRQCDPLVSCIIKHTAKAVCFIMVEARGVALANGLGPVADLTCHWHAIQHRSHVRRPVFSPRFSSHSSASNFASSTAFLNRESFLTLSKSPGKPESSVNM